MADRRRPDPDPRRSQPTPNRDPAQRRTFTSSARLLAQRPAGLKLPTTATWQAKLWEYYDEVPEFRFGVGWMANGLSRVNLATAVAPANQGDEPTLLRPPDDEGDPPLSPLDLEAMALVGAIAGGPDSQGRMLASAAIQLSVPGSFYILVEAEPGDQVPADPAVEAGITIDDAEADEDLAPAPEPSWVWRILSTDEIKVDGEVYKRRCGDDKWADVNMDAFVLVEVKHDHPHNHWLADSPARAVLGTLRQIHLLDEHINATATSRLAGSGILGIAAGAQAMTVRQGPRQNVNDDDPAEYDEGEEVVENDLAQDIYESATQPIADRGVASAVVPYMVEIPLDVLMAGAKMFEYQTFWSEFSDAVEGLRNAAIKRLAIGLDMPPEVLLGMADSNHWTAWQIEETAITLHLEPMAEVICQAMTDGFLRPALRAMGHSDVEAARYLVWYDTTDLTTRPDRSDDAIAAYDRIEITSDALLTELGLPTSYKPKPPEVRERLLMKMIMDHPEMAVPLMRELGLITADTAAALEAINATSTPAPGELPAADGDGTSEQGPPDQQGVQAAAVPPGLLEACDGIVHRALERAGQKVRGKAGKTTPGGHLAVHPDVPPDELHTHLEASAYLSLDDMLTDAWSRVPLIAVRYDIDRDHLERTLTAYTRGLIAAGHTHDDDRLAVALSAFAR